MSASKPLKIPVFVLASGRTHVDDRLGISFQSLAQHVHRRFPLARQAYSRQFVVRKPSRKKDARLQQFKDRWTHNRRSNQLVASSQGTRTNDINRQMRLIEG